MTDFSKHHPVPASLREELSAREDAAELERVWNLLARVDAPDAEGSGASSDALWQRIAEATGIATPSQRSATTRMTADTDMPSDADTDAYTDTNATTSPVPTLTVARGGSVPSRRSAVRRAPWTIRARTGLAAAASVAVMAWWGLGDVRVSTPAGATRTVALRDGSTIVLNGASVMQYPRYFRPAWLGGDGRRSVTLSGEAYFRVAKGLVPFVVHTAEAEVQVLGTRFNVRSRNARAAQRVGGAYTDVAVEEGLVQVSARAAQSPASVRLRAAEHVRVVGASSAAAETPLEVTQGDPRRDLAWTNGGFAAVDQPLHEVLAALESQYGVELTMRDSAATAASITLYYPERTTVDRIVNDLATARGWTTRRTSRGFELRVAR